MDSQIQPSGYGFNSQRPGRIQLPVSKPDPVPAKTSSESDGHKFDRETMAYVLEDVRLSTLQRKLVRESGSVKQMALAVQVTVVHVSSYLRFPDKSF